MERKIRKRYESPDYPMKKSRTFTEPYLNILKVPPEPFFERKVFLTPESRTAYSSALPGIHLTELQQLIHSYNTPEELGTPREKCFNETHNGDNEICFNAINNKSHCTFYCLLRDLPTHMIIIDEFSRARRHDERGESESDETDEEDEDEVPLNVTISLNQSDNSKLRFMLEYDDEKKNYNVKMTIIQNGHKILENQQISLDDLRNLTSYYDDSQYFKISPNLEDENYDVVSFLPTESIWNNIKLPFHNR